MQKIRDVLIAIATLSIALLPVAARAADITVFAAASLKESLSDIERNWENHTGNHAAISFAASSVLARQIEAAGGADMFISADVEWMDYLERRGVLAAHSRRILLGNHLVLIEPASAHTTLRIESGFDLSGALAGGRLAVADPDFVPAGKYAKSALTSLGVWSAVSGRLARAENVRVALAYVARGDAPLGIVYTTDALAEPQVRIVGTFPDSTHPPIVYPAALTLGSKPLARGFLDYLSGREANAIFRRYGFVILNGR